MEAKTGDRVLVHYIGRFESGEVFDSSVEREEPIEFVLGAGSMIPGFERAVQGMKPEESKLVTIPAAEAYGPKRDENILEFSRDTLPEDLNPLVGDQLLLTTADGQKFPVTVTVITETMITLDGNHPMAGKDLVFEIRLVKIL